MHESVTYHKLSDSNVVFILRDALRNIERQANDLLRNRSSNTNNIERAITSHSNGDTASEKRMYKWLPSTRTTATGDLVNTKSKIPIEHKVQTTFKYLKAV